MSAFRYARTTTLPARESRHPWSDGLRVNSAVAFSFATSLIWLVFYNERFWRDTVQAMWHGSATSAGFLLSLGIFALGAQALLMLLLPRRLMVPATSLLFIVAALASYFTEHYGIVMNKDMMRNVLQTDVTETQELLSSQLLQWIMVFGVLPAAMVLKVRLPAVDLWSAVKQRALAITGILVVSVLALLSCSSSYAVYFREHKPIRFSLAPIAPVATGLQLLAGHERPTGAVVNVSGTAYSVAATRARPLVVMIVVGETARASDFQLGGYARATNPHLGKQPDLIYFRRATSCGTSTAVSVPCMFSHLPREQFDIDDAPRHANLLDALQEAGFDVEWRDNNAGCKGVCARVRQISYADRKDPVLCERDYCYDEVLLEGMEEKLRTIERDTVIVLHMIGSHGPAYAARYPARFAKFTPACNSNQLQRCSGEEIANAYDNTIVYADYVLSRAIDELRAASSRIDSVLLYASDHGESLGEQGIYLHGLPYRFAPQTQKEVPMLLWTSNSYARQRRLDRSCLQAIAGQPVSHDNIYHTVLGAAQVRNASYDPQLDLFGRCSDLSADHE